jgi:hypothetical protein
MTLRELIKTADLELVFNHINDKDNGYITEEKVPIKRTVDAYSKVVKELLSKKKVRPYVYKIVVNELKEVHDGEMYIDVCLLNPRYVAPTPGLKPWGGKRGEKIPKGYYNCNLTKHNDRFAIGAIGWSKLIDTHIINKTIYSDERILAEILWELTFYGWSEKKVKNTWKDIDKKIKQADKEIKEGKFIEIPPKTEGGKKIVIPDSVLKQLADISEGPINFQNL